QPAETRAGAGPGRSPRGIAAIVVARVVTVLVAEGIAAGAPTERKTGQLARGSVGRTALAERAGDDLRCEVPECGGTPVGVGGSPACVGGADLPVVGREPTEPAQSDG